MSCQRIVFPCVSLQFPQGNYSLCLESHVDMIRFYQSTRTSSSDVIALQNTGSYKSIELSFGSLGIGEQGTRSKPHCSLPGFVIKSNVCKATTGL